MTKLTACLSRIAKIAAKVVLPVGAVVLGLLTPVSAQEVSAQDKGADFKHLEKELAQLGPDKLEELFVFVAGNTLFTLYHEGGHMLVSELGLPVLAQEEDAVDNLATVTMLADGSEDMDLYLTNAMVGWFLIAEANDDDLIFYDEHDLDQQRGYRMLCLMVGSDEEAFLDLALELGLPEDRVDTCGADYELASDSWDAATDAYLRDAGTPGGKASVVYEPAPDGLGSIELFLKESRLLETIAQEFDTVYDLPKKITFRAKTCGTENAFWDPDTREVVLCHELLAGFADLYLGVLKDE